MDKVNGAHGPFSAVLLIFTLCGLARGDEIYLSDGRVIDGVVVSSPDADIVDVRVGAGTLVAIQHFPKAKVQRVVYGISSRQTAINEVTKQIATLSTRKDVTASEWWSLVRRLYDFGEISSAKELAARVVMIDRDHREARKLLGMTLYHGVWMRLNEVATARGEVFSHGAWMTWAAKEQIEAGEHRRSEEQAVARKEREEQRRQVRVSAAIAAENEANANAAYADTYVSGYYRSPYYHSYGNTFGGVYYNGYRPLYPMYRGYSTGYPHCGGGWHIGASGGGSNSAWKFTWNGGLGLGF